ncbi:hypothetical protein TNCV_2066721 [Trichonephila clavipes]|uniref:Uncharacterized protein n=1 Tax=Trichonephila clavipes TaxID=2585209 RepID=A0A8X6W383_TRICX|nr:hypothetical protein TNCV_2066721 [Trichonephila clavipes]
MKANPNLDVGHVRRSAAASKCGTLLPVDKAGSTGRGIGCRFRSVDPCFRTSLKDPLFNRSALDVVWFFHVEHIASPALFQWSPTRDKLKLSGATAHEGQALLIGAEVQEQMSRSGGQSEARPPVFKSSDKLPSREVGQ